MSEVLGMLRHLVKAMPRALRGGMSDETKKGIITACQKLTSKAYDSLEVPTWQSRDGRVIPIREMGDQHLLNATRLVIRRHEQEWGGQQFLHPEDGMPIPYPPVLKHLEDECKRRGINWRRSWP